MARKAWQWTRDLLIGMAFIAVFGLLVVGTLYRPSSESKREAAERAALRAQLGANEKVKEVIRLVLEKKHADGKAKVIGVTEDGKKVYAVEGIHYGQRPEGE